MLSCVHLFSVLLSYLSRLPNLCHSVWLVLSNTSTLLSIQESSFSNSLFLNTVKKFTQYHVNINSAYSITTKTFVLLGNGVISSLVSKHLKHPITLALAPYATSQRKYRILIGTSSTSNTYLQDSLLTSSFLFERVLSSPTKPQLTFSQICLLLNCFLLNST